MAKLHRVLRKWQHILSTRFELVPGDADDLLEIPLVVFVGLRAITFPIGHVPDVGLCLQVVWSDRLYNTIFGASQADRLLKTHWITRHVATHMYPLIGPKLLSRAHVVDETVFLITRLSACSSIWVVTEQDGHWQGHSLTASHRVSKRIELPIRGGWERRIVDKIGASRHLQGECA